MPLDETRDAARGREHHAHREHDGGDHDLDAIDHAHCGDHRVQREHDVEQQDLDDHAPERRCDLRLPAVSHVAFEILMYLIRALPHEKQTAEDQDEVAAADLRCGLVGLGGSRQAVLVAGLAAVPAGVGFGIRHGHAHHRLGCALGEAGVLPVARCQYPQHGSALAAPGGRPAVQPAQTLQLDQLAAPTGIGSPVRADIPVDSLPPVLRRARDEIRPEPMDWKLLEEQGADWIESRQSDADAAARWK